MIKQKKESGWSVTLRVLRAAVLIDLGIFAVTGLGCWLAGWRTLFQYGNALVIAGALVAVMGAYSAVGSWGTRDFTYQYSQSASGQSILERTQRSILDTYKSFAFVVQSALAGGIAIAAGILLQNLFPKTP